MDLDRLRTFLTIIDSGSMTAAATRLHLTQPALSRALRALEDELGVALFERIGRGLVLSQAGRSLEADARRLIDDAAQITRKIRLTSERRYFDLRLGAVDSVVTTALPGVIERLRARFPGLGIKLYADRSAPLRARLERDELDYAIVALHGPAPGDLRATRLIPYRLRYFGRKDRFPTLARAAALQDLAEFPLVNLATPDDRTPDCAPATDSFAVTGSMASTKALVLSGFGVGALVDFTVTPRERERLVASRFSNEGDDCHLYLVRAEAQGLPGDLDKLLESELKAALKGLLE